MKILITGGNGYIAKALSDKLDNVTSVTRKDFDLTDREATNDWFYGRYFDIVIHTAIKGGSRLQQDNSSVFYQNIQMFYNLLNNKHCFGKLLNFGSGAELSMPTDPYGLSKNVISKIIDLTDNFYNIRIHGVFDENELNTRFIKSNIKRYINRKPIEIYQDKLMDFFYMEDLIRLVEYFIYENNLPKNIDCSYSQHHSLSDVAYLINNLSDYKVKININSNEKGKDYIGDWNPLNIKWKGLKYGIDKTYDKLLEENYFKNQQGIIV